ncbi:MAG: ribonuclease H-like YkuK family protein [Candidatus Liptonbacteria bacterium]
MEDDTKFNSAYGIKRNLPELARDLITFMQVEPLFKYKITIGTDSQKNTEGKVDFVTAVVIHRIGHGGRYFWRRLNYGKFHTLRDRIIKEVLLSLEFGQKVLAELRNSLPQSGPGAENIPGWEFEIHADVGEGGATKSLIQEVVGMIRAYNFAPITKPDSYAASNVADRHTH